MKEVLIYINLFFMALNACLAIGHLLKGDYKEANFSLLVAIFNLCGCIFIAVINQ